MSNDVTRTGPPRAADPDATRSAGPHPPSDAACPVAVPGYAVRHEIGRGAMGVVYEATHLGLARTVALKMLKRADLADRVAAARFLAEAQVVAAVRHPHVVAVFDFGETADTAYLAMELLDGGTLADKLKAAGRLEPRAAAELFAALAAAVGAVHAQGIVHRDLKPGNVLFAAGGTPKVADFGLAKRTTSDLTATQAVMGTPAYMSPEQASGQAKFVGPAADVWALGVMLYEALAGRRPFASENTASLLVQIQKEEPAALRSLTGRVPRDLETICLKCLEKEPERRYATAGELADDLARFLAGQPIVARPVGAAERLAKWVRRNRALAAALAVVFLTLLAGVGVSSWFAWVARQNEALANRKAKEAADDRDLARTAADESRRRMVRLNILTGTRSLDAGDAAAALLWFHQAWDLDRDEPDAEPSHRARIAGLLQSWPDFVGGAFHPAPVLDAAFSPGGTRVLTRTAGRELYLWDYERFRLAAPPLAHAATVNHACWNADGTRVAAAGADGEVAVWDPATATRVHTFRHAAAVTWVEFHPNQPRLLTASEDGTVKLWDLATGKPLDWTLPLAAVVDHAAFSPDGSRVVTASRDDAVRVWAVDGAKPLSPPLPYRASTATERYQFHYDRWPRFHPDGQAVVSFKGDDLIVWPGSGDAFKTFPMGYAVTEVYWIPGTDHVLATGNKYSRAAVVRASDGRDVYVLRHPRQANVGTASADGKRLMTASSGGVIHLWDAATGAALWAPQRCADFASAVQVSRDGRRCLAASQDGTVRVWAVEGRRPEVRPYQPDGRMNYVTLPRPDKGERAYSADGRTWVDSGGGRPATVTTGDRTRPLPAGVVAARFCNAGHRVVLTTADGVRLWDAERLEPAGPPVPLTYEKNAEQLQDRLSHDGTRLAAWDDARTVSVWDLATGRRVFGPVRNDNPGPLVFGPKEGDGVVTGLVMSPDGKRLAAATDSAGTLTVWDVEAGTTLNHARRFRGYVQGFNFSADGERVLLWASDNIARVYRADTGEPVGPGVRPALSKAQYVRVNANECAISGDGRRLAFYESGLATVRVWDADRADGLFAVNFPAAKAIGRMWFAPDGGTVNLIADDQALSIPVPRFVVPTDQTRPLVRFLTGQQIDATDGLEFIDQFSFIKDVPTYRRAALAWKGLPDDPAAQPR